MNEVYFNPNGGVIKATATFSQKEVMVANYEITVREKDSNTATKLKSGDNMNTEDDEVLLPTPSSGNDGRRVVLETGYAGNNIDVYPDYDIVLEIHQDGKLRGFKRDSGKLTGKGQYSLLYVLLIAKTGI